jgi:hypothetical protein
MLCKTELLTLDSSKHNRMQTNSKSKDFLRVLRFSVSVSLRGGSPYSYKPIILGMNNRTVGCEGL